MNRPQPSRFFFRQPQIKRIASFAVCYAVALVWAGQMMTATKAARFADAGSIKGTVNAVTGDANAPLTLLSGARLTLANRALPDQIVKTLTDDAGSFAFTDLPAAFYILTIEADGFPTVTREIDLATGAKLTVEIQLATANISETVNVRDEEGLLSTAETTTSNIVRSQTLTDLPLRAENFQSALLLTPGVVRDREGLDHIKGARAGQSAYTVNGLDITDPVTGQLAFDIPIEAAATVQIEENPYSAEFGRLTGGVTSLETKSGGNKFSFKAARFAPTFRRILGGPLDSFRPRITFSGPVVRDRLFFLQSFEYRFTRTRVPSLIAPRDDSVSESFNSFTQFDLNVNKTNSVKFVAALFPQKARNIGLNTFNPQPTTPNFKQRGALFEISEQAIFSDASFLSSQLSYRIFDVDVFAQGSQPLTLLPEANTGNYFADTRRRSSRIESRETYFARPFTLRGQHSVKAGTEFYRTRVSGRFRDNSILIRRNNSTLAQRIDFSVESVLVRRSNEVAAFVQDRWTVNKKLTIDAGLRFDRDQIVSDNNVAPRLAIRFLPFDRTIIRGGIGLFYDRTPFSVSYFTQLPERIVTNFAPDGLTITDGARRFNNIIEGQLHNPRSVRFNLQLDRDLTVNLKARVGYLVRSTTNDFLILPRTGATTAISGNALALSSTGRSRYRELQFIMAYNKPRIGNLNAAYVRSSTRGDLNTVDNFLGDTPAFVVRPNEYAPLPFDAPNRFILYGELRTRYRITVSPSLELRSGYPYSVVNERLDFVGLRNRAGRFPNFISLDAQVTKGFTLPKFVPKFEGRNVRVGVAVFNIGNHFNPRDVQNNTDSPNFGRFYNSLGTSFRGKFELDF